MLDTNNLEKDGFVSVKYPNTLRKAVENAMNSWQNFCQLSDEEKTLFSRGDRIKDFGYMRRQDAGPKADNKELFHASRQNMSVLEERAKNIKNDRATSFIKDVGILIDESRPLITEFINSIEKTYKIEDLKERVLKASERWTFRYLHYFPTENDMLANAHADRGDMTLHLYESHDGGEYLDFDNKWRAWPVSQERTIIFPAMGLQYETEGKLKALWHRIKTTEETRKVGRFAMVAFIDFNQEYSWDTFKYNKVQEFEPGFNYSLLFQDFKKFFVAEKLQM